MSKICPKCGVQLDDNVKFCSNCGASFAADTPPKPITPQTAAPFAPPPVAVPPPAQPLPPSPAEPPKKGSGGKKAAVIIALILVILIAGGVGLFFLLRGKDDDSSSASKKKSGSSKKTSATTEASTEPDEDETEEETEEETEDETEETTEEVTEEETEEETTEATTEATTEETTEKTTAASTTSETVTEAPTKPHKTALSTNDRPKPAEFAWFKNEMIDGKLPDGIEYLTSAEEFCGGWKGVIIYDPLRMKGEFNISEYVNFNISGSGDNIELVIDWYQMWPEYSEIVDETENPDITLHGYEWADGIYVDYTTFSMQIHEFYEKDGMQYAVGTICTESGETAYVGMVRP